ncbi:MAG: hypothetical protein NTY15_21195 [Planctomycetota bacterium]|nr:hypothetical protein [Planctomycetota bacterium]
MLSSVRKNFVRSLCAIPLTVSCGFAQSPTGTLPESVTVSAPSSTQINDLFVNQWVQVDEANSIRGSVVALHGLDSLPLTKMRVTLSQNGKPIVEDDTDVIGEFLLENVTPGLYTLTAEGGNSMAMFSLVVLDRVAGKHLPNTLSVRVMPDSGRVSEIIRGQSSPTQLSYEMPKADPLGKNRKVTASHQVMLDSNGTLVGRLGKASAAVDMSKMTVFLMKDGEEVSRGRVAADGSFAISGLAPSCYGLVAAGDQGFAAVGFCAVNRAVASSKPTREIFVAQTMQAPSSLNIEVADPVVSETPTEVVYVEEPEMLTPAGMGGGGAGGGGFGGGGGAGGGGGLGLGGIAAIGGLTAAAIVAADNNNNSPTVSPVAP